MSFLSETPTVRLSACYAKAVRRPRTPSSQPDEVFGRPTNHRPVERIRPFPRHKVHCLQEPLVRLVAWPTGIGWTGAARDRSLAEFPGRIKASIEQTHHIFPRLQAPLAILRVFRRVARWRCQKCGAGWNPAAGCQPARHKPVHPANVVQRSSENFWSLPFDSWLWMRPICLQLPPMLSTT